jgi:putative hemolysin
MTPERAFVQARRDSKTRSSLPALTEMYLRIGSLVCGPLICDRALGTVEFIVTFDLLEMDPKYRRMFLDS